MEEITKIYSKAMFKVSNHYYNIEDYEQMKKYCLLAIDAGNTMAMFNLGRYYKECENNHELFMKYHLMAINEGDTDAIVSLGIYYYQIADYKMAEKYYLIGG